MFNFLKRVHYNLISNWNRKVLNVSERYVPTPNEWGTSHESAGLETMAWLSGLLYKPRKYHERRK